MCLKIDILIYILSFFSLPYVVFREAQSVSIVSVVVYLGHLLLLLDIYYYNVAVLNQKAQLCKIHVRNKYWNKRLFLLYQNS